MMLLGTGEDDLSDATSARGRPPSGHPLELPWCQPYLAWPSGASGHTPMWSCSSSSITRCSMPSASV
ncbi:hypothetical protein ACVWXU_006369 [Streptomyces sp. TE33382]